jgi:predicted N-acetyltransferase YhbS
VDIRERREDDLDELVAVAARVKRVDGYPRFVAESDLARFLTRPKSMMAWVAVREGRIVGHVALNDTTTAPVMQLVEDRGSSQPAVYVARLLVDPTERRDGVGRGLLHQAQRAAVEAVRSPFVDVVDTPSAAAAISLYRCSGWVEIGRVRVDLVGNDVNELVFCAPLT